MPPSTDQSPDEVAGGPVAEAADKYVRDKIYVIEECLTRVLFGDYSALVQMDDADPLWGNLAMHINVALRAAHTALQKAERLEAEAAKARDEAIEAMQYESRFLSNVSHELRTPLTAIRAFAEILMEYADEDPVQRHEFLRIILTESDRLTRLINQVLDLDRIGQTQFQPTWTSIKQTLEEVVATNAIAGAERGVTVELHLAVEIPMSYASSDQLKQVWTNLLGNAIKFSGDGGLVRVTALCEDGEIRVAVSDQGAGIAADQLPRIFDRFHQVCDATMTDKPRGTGLGLSIAREIVDLHGGRIEVESEVGVGSTFRVSLPVRTVAPNLVAPSQVVPKA